MLIKVTQEHIDKGTKGCISNCAVALAIDDLLSLDYRALVDPTEISIQDYSTQRFVCDLDTPDSVVDFTGVFDTRKHESKPFQFELPIPREYLKPEYQTQE